MESDGVLTNTTTQSTSPEWEGISAAEGNLEDGPKPAANKRIRFRVQYVSKENEVLHQYETSGPNLEEETVASGPKPAFEVVTTFKSNKKAAIQENEKDTEQRYTSAAPSRSMRILSGAIAHALRSVVQFYPSQDLASDIIKIDYPYAVLVHHYDELVEYRERVSVDSPEELCHREKDAYEDLCVLLEFLDEHIMPAVEEERARNRRGYVSYEGFWINLKPGNTIVAHAGTSNEYYAGVVHSLSGGHFVTPATTWQLYYWSLDYDGSVIGRRKWSMSFTKWEGEVVEKTRSVDLRTRPREEDVETIIEQGKLYWGLLKKQCKYFKGKTKEFPHTEVDGLVMVDIDELYGANDRFIPQLMDTDVDNRASIPGCSCTVCSRRRAPNANSSGVLFENIYPKLATDLKDDQLFLLPKNMWAYVFKTRHWELLPVGGFTQPDFEEELIDNLVMEEKRLKTLKALAKSFARVNQFGEGLKEEHWSADFVKGKGNGLIFLLHGKPGVGKTCTAECIAAYTSRPLMVLTSSDIGTNPVEVEMNLTMHFKRARRWGSVLLIDEADVFMERRSTADLTRNSLVAGFLRALEFYEGILFLTTNRVGFFDDAFISRIHVQLYYPDFDDVSRRKVWQTFIDKLEKERGDYVRLNAIAKEYLDGSELRAVKWNGREIRNAFQTAVALAEYEAKKDSEGKILLTDEHLKSVVEMSKDFKDYLDKLHRGDEGKRAARRFERLDE